ncbi:MAG TPA: DUF3189 family protein [Symbiobacteriaceae bacterium]|nr:DUF3189 family protein [Symbiobacteriaceae bacterium]
MQVIYHSRGTYPALLAAAIHVGALPASAPADLASALERLGGHAAMQTDGLREAGLDAAGRRVFGLGRTARPEVTRRAFHAIADLAGIHAEGFELCNVGPAIAWDDLRVRVLGWLGFSAAAHRAQLAGLKRIWPLAARAAAQERAGGTVPEVDPPAPGEVKPSLKVIYHCYGSAHSSVTAANIHVGVLPLDRRPSPFEILHQPLFDRAKTHEVGLARLMGVDEWGNEVYVLGLAGSKNQLRQGLIDFLALWGVPDGRFRFEPTLHHAGIILRVGGYASRGLGWVVLGRPLCALGVWLKYPLFAGHVQQVRNQVALTGHAVSDIIG